jgi:flagellar hook-associated protein 2
MSATSGTSSATSGTLGDVPPVSFPGIASGIDYDSIIEKYTADTLQQEKPTQTQINNLTQQNTAILKLQNLIGAVQDSLTALSNPQTFGAYKATVANAANGSPAATATQITGETPVAGTYAINGQTVATSTSILNSATANGTLSATQPLDNAGTAIAATNGSASNGKITINGVQLNYDVTTQTIGQIVTAINGLLQTNDGGTATLNANGTVTLTGVTSLGSGADSGNLEQVLKLDTAQIVGGNVTSSSPISGIDESSVLNQNNNAGFATAVTSGTFTINGVQFTVDATKNSLSDLITQINGSAAGVTATYNSQTSALVLTSKTAGPTGILLGASGDTSNFLAAAGLTTASGSTTIAGTQASLTYTDVTGQHTVFSSTNDFTSAIPGIDLNITASGGSSAPGAPTFYTVNVASDPSQAETAINAFIKAYNVAISTLNADTVAPTVTAGSDATTGTATSSSSAGGVLYGNYQISGLRDQLVNLVSGFIPSGSSAYNSLQSVGIELDTNSQTVGTTDADDTTDSTTGASKSDSSFTVNATSGELSALDTTAFEAAYAANTTAVQNLFTLEPTLNGTQAGAQPVVGSNYGFSYLLGSTLANIDGLATFLTGSVVTPDNLSNVLLTSITDNNDQQIDSLQQQIALINTEATNQADQLRAQFTASETQIAELQALQGQIAAIGH